MDYCFSTIGLGTIWRRYVELKKYLWRSTLFWLSTFFFFISTPFASLCSLAQKIWKKGKKRTKNKQTTGHFGEICKKKGREESTLQKFRKCSKFLFSILENFPIYYYQWYNIKIASSLRWPNAPSTKIIRAKKGVILTQLDS